MDRHAKQTIRKHVMNMVMNGGTEVFEARREALQANIERLNKKEARGVTLSDRAKQNREENMFELRLMENLADVVDIEEEGDL